MPTSREPPDAGAGASSAGATGSQPQQDPQQEAVRSAKGVEFLHAGSGNSLGDGRTAGGSANVAAREVLPDTNAGADKKDDGSSPTKVAPGRP